MNVKVVCILFRTLHEKPSDLFSLVMWNKYNALIHVCSFCTCALFRCGLLLLRSINQPTSIFGHTYKPFYTLSGLSAIGPHSISPTPGIQGHHYHHPSLGGSMHSHSGLSSGSHSGVGYFQWRRVATKLGIE